jgi:hypothetical protein
VQTVGLPITVLLAAVSAAGQNIQGDWHGAVEVENDAPLRLALHITLGNLGVFKATLDSVDEDGTALPVDSFTANGSAVRFEMKDIGGIYEGKIATDGASITGSWRQNGALWQLTWERGGDPADMVELFDRNKTAQEGRSYMQSFYESRFSDLWAKLSPVMRQALASADKLRELRAQVQRQFGLEANVIEESVNPDGALQVYRRLAKFENFPRDVEMQVAFNPRGMVSTFSIRPVE